MATYGEGNRQGADRTKIPLLPLESMAVQLLVLEICRTLLAHLLVLLAVRLLAVHAAVLDEAARRAVLQPDRVTGDHAAVGAGYSTIILAFAGILHRHAAHDPRAVKRNSST